MQQVLSLCKTMHVMPTAHDIVNMEVRAYVHVYVASSQKMMI